MPLCNIALSITVFLVYLRRNCEYEWVLQNQAGVKLFAIHIYRVLLVIINLYWRGNDTANMGYTYMGYNDGCAREHVRVRACVRVCVCMRHGLCVTTWPRVR